jgi:Alkylmercury lyase
MLLFRSEEDIDEWCRSTAQQRGGVVPVEVLNQLARRWYGDRLDPAWRPRRRDESQAILEAVGLSGPFWRLP